MVCPLAPSAHCLGGHGSLGGWSGGTSVTRPIDASGRTWSLEIGKARICRPWEYRAGPPPWARESRALHHGGNVPLAKQVSPRRRRMLPRGQAHGKRPAIRPKPPVVPGGVVTERKTDHAESRCRWPRRAGQTLAPSQSPGDPGWRPRATCSACLSVRTLHLLGRARDNVHDPVFSSGRRACATMSSLPRQ